MRFVLDENISAHTEAWLRVQGHTVWRAAIRTPDPHLLAAAAVKHAILLTRDTDFLAFAPSKRCGIVVIRIHPSIAEAITEAVSRLLRTLTASQFRGRTIILRRDGYEIIG